MPDDVRELLRHRSRRSVMRVTEASRELPRGTWRGKVVVDKPSTTMHRRSHDLRYTEWKRVEGQKEPPCYGFWSLVESQSPSLTWAKQCQSLMKEFSKPLPIIRKCLLPISLVSLPSVLLPIKHVYLNMYMRLCSSTVKDTRNIRHGLDPLFPCQSGK